MVTFLEVAIMNAVLKQYDETSRVYSDYPYQSRRVIGSYQQPVRCREAVAIAVETATFSARQNTIIFILLNAIIFLMVVLGITKFSGFSFKVADLKELELPGVKIVQSPQGGAYRQPGKRYTFIREYIQKINPSVNADEMTKVIIRESAQAGYDPFFIVSIILSESTFRPQVVSNKGAIGLMQLLPSTAQYIAKKERINWLGTSSLYTYEYNIRLGIRYVQYLENMFNGNKRLALMAYNWGPGNVQKALRGSTSVLPQVQQYAQKILKRETLLQQNFKKLEAV